MRQSLSKLFYYASPRSRPSSYSQHRLGSPRDACKSRDQNLHPNAAFCGQKIAIPRYQRSVRAQTKPPSCTVCQNVPDLPEATEHFRTDLSRDLAALHEVCAKNSDELRTLSNERGAQQVSERRRTCTPLLNTPPFDSLSFFFFFFSHLCSTCWKSCWPSRSSSSRSRLSTPCPTATGSTAPPLPPSLHPPPPPPPSIIPSPCRGLLRRSAAEEAAYACSAPPLLPPRSHRHPSCSSSDPPAHPSAIPRELCNNSSRVQQTVPSNSKSIQTHKWLKNTIVLLQLSPSAVWLGFSSFLSRPNRKRFQGFLCTWFVFW